MGAKRYRLLLAVTVLVGVAQLPVPGRSCPGISAAVLLSPRAEGSEHRRDSVVLPKRQIPSSPARSIPCAVRTVADSTHPNTGYSGSVDFDPWRSADVAVTRFHLDPPSPHNVSGTIPASGTDTMVTIGAAWRGGSGAAKAAGSVRTFQLDTVGGHVGNRLRMSLRIDPPLLEEDAILDVRVWLSFNPDALYPHSAQSGGRPLRLEYDPDGGLDLQLTGASQPLTGGTLIELELEGLITGRASNVVRLDSLEFMGDRFSVLGGDGLVRLTGCEVGKRFEKGAAIVSVVPNPVYGPVRISYRSTNGLPINLRVTDLTGRSVNVTELGIGDGSEETVTLALDGLQSGLYVLELSDGVETQTTPLLIRR